MYMAVMGNPIRVCGCVHVCVHIYTGMNTCIEQIWIRVLRKMLYVFSISTDMVKLLSNDYESQHLSAV